MARNQEKAQSMLYRFREAQATSLGVSTKPARRPRLASSVSSLKECERWRSDVIREISRKVSKIQDFGLNDYEVRDLNDEINKLLREKGHWENQIVALGGANYKRGVPSMLGDDKGVVGRGGYKYFGRAKDLPGVKELFTSQKADEAGRSEERYERFRNLPPSYYGDEDEDDGLLLEQERSAEEVEWNERFWNVVQGLKHDLQSRDDHDNMHLTDAEDDELGGIQVPKIPRPSPRPLKQSVQAVQASLSAAYNQRFMEHAATPAESTSKRAPQDELQTPAKRHKNEQGHPIPPTHHADAEPSRTTLEPPSVADYSIFSPEDLQPPPIPDRAAIEKLILQAKKKQLRQEYIGA